MDTNDSLRLASLWHSMHAISQQLSPVVECYGIELLQAENFDLHCFQSLTGSNLITPVLLIRVLNENYGSNVNILIIMLMHALNCFLLNEN